MLKFPINITTAWAQGQVLEFPEFPAKSPKRLIFSGKKHKIAFLNNPAVKVNKSLRDKELKAQ